MDIVMTQEEIIELACQTFGGIIKKEERKNFLDFARLVAEKERDACADTARLALQHIHKVGEIAESAIRARGHKGVAK